MKPSSFVLALIVTGSLPVASFAATITTIGNANASASGTAIATGPGSNAVSVDNLAASLVAGGPASGSYSHNTGSLTINQAVGVSGGVGENHLQAVSPGGGTALVNGGVNSSASNTTVIQGIPLTNLPGLGGAQ